MDNQNGPYEANFRGPFVKKGPAGSLHGPKGSIFSIGLKTRDKLEFTPWFEVNRTIGS